LFIFYIPHTPVSLLAMPAAKRYW